MNAVESICDTVVPTVSSDENISRAKVSEHDDAFSSDFDDQHSSSVSSEESISFFMCDH